MLLDQWKMRIDVVVQVESETWFLRVGEVNDCSHGVFALAARVLQVDVKYSKLTDVLQKWPPCWIYGNQVLGQSLGTSSKQQSQCSIGVERLIFSLFIRAKYSNEFSGDRGKI